MENINKDQFENNSNEFIENSIREYVVTNSGNLMTEFNEKIFDEPLIGFVAGDDPLFLEYKKVVGDFHLTPKEALEMRMRQIGKNNGIPPAVSVISWILPFAKKIRASMRKEARLPSLRWNHARWQGQEFNDNLARHITSLLEGMGYVAFSPTLESFFTILDTPEGRASNWSQRHVAYAAGLGTFSLSDGFITSRGIAMRCGSIITNALFTPSTRPYKNHTANCLFYQDGSCGKCIKRCPAEAISEQGHDRNKCRTFLQVTQVALLKDEGRDGYIGRFPGCGLCQTKVPCEHQTPRRVRDRKSSENQ
jgi:epoxyqueuosine reductase